jgi:hypothetical protein
MLKQKGFTIMDLFAALGVLLWLSAVCAIVYVAWHFIVKYW